MPYMEHHWIWYHSVVATGLEKAASTSFALQGGKVRNKYTGRDGLGTCVIGDRHMDKRRGIAVVLAMPFSRSNKELRTYLLMVYYQRRHIENLAAHVK